MSSLYQRLKEPQAPPYALAIPEWFGKATVRASCDTAIGLSRGEYIGLHLTLKKAGAHLIPHDYNPYWHSHHVTRPTLEHMGLMHEDADCKNRFDVAIDFYLPDGWWSEKCCRWLANHVNMKWKHCSKRWYHGDDGSETLYWEDTNLRNGIPARAMALYAKQHDERIIRLEVRFQCTGALPPNGLADWSPKGLRSINPRAVLQKHVKLTDLCEQYVQGHRRLSLYRRWPRWKLDDLCEYVRQAALVTKGVVQPLPTQPMPEAIVDAFMAMIPKRLSW